MVESYFGTICMDRVMGWARHEHLLIALANGNGKIITQFDGLLMVLKLLIHLSHIGTYLTCKLQANIRNFLKLFFREIKKIFFKEHLFITQIEHI